MSVSFDCPFCSYIKNVPDNFYGKKIKCPRCLATLTLGVPQPTELTALPLPKAETSLNVLAIELEKQEVSEKECPICLQLIYEGKECSVYKRYTELLKNSTGEKQITDEDLLTDYEKIKDTVDKNYRWGFYSLVYGVSFVLGPIVILNNYKILPEVCENLERGTRRKVNASFFMAATGILSSCLVSIGLLYRFL